MLDSLDKLAKILFSGIASTVIAYAGYNVNWEKLGMERDKFCFDYASSINPKLLENSEKVPAHLVKRYQKQCDLTEEEAAEALNNQKTDLEQASAPHEPSAGLNALQGYVAIGSADSHASYSQINFDIAGEGKPAVQSGRAPGKGDVLAARWSVNVRESTAVTTGGGNPIRGLLNKDDCVEVTKAPELLRGQYWAEIKKASCRP